jgi:hypothetical protein
MGEGIPTFEALIGRRARDAEGWRRDERSNEIQTNSNHINVTP